MNQPLNTHCPGCGLARAACVNIVDLDNGQWECQGCRSKSRVGATVPLSCQATTGSHDDCERCGGLGSVRVPVDALRVYDPRTHPKPKKVLTESGS